MALSWCPATPKPDWTPRNLLTSRVRPAPCCLRAQMALRPWKGDPQRSGIPQSAHCGVRWRCCSSLCGAHATRPRRALPSRHLDSSGFPGLVQRFPKPTAKRPTLLGCSPGQASRIGAIHAGLPARQPSSLSRRRRMLPGASNFTIAPATSEHPPRTSRRCAAAGTDRQTHPQCHPGRSSPPPPASAHTAGTP